MDASLLKKLQKNKPKERVPVNILVKTAQHQHKVQLKTNVVDKLSQKLIEDRSEILKKIGATLAVENLTPPEKSTPKKEKKEKKEEGNLEVKISKKPVKKLEHVKLLPTEEGEIPNVTTLPIAKSPIKAKAKAKTKVTISEKGDISGPVSLLQIEDIETRLPTKEKQILLKSSSYYMNNREIFINFMNAFFEPYKKELEANQENYNCDSKSGNKFELLTHQKIVRDYINLYTPYRGVLLYHGLGSGKTCSSIGIAEGIKTDKHIIIMTPASLKKNYIEELKKCADELYKRNQYWEFINTNTNPELLEPLSYILSLPVDYIKKRKGAWLVNIKKDTNYSTLTAEQQESLNRQLDMMINNKYEFIKYNGLRKRHIDNMSINDTINYFSNKVVIIDEAHNFVSRIVNKLNKPDAPFMRLYNYLMEAENCKIILLTGTPIINYPNELAIAMNILRGKIKTWQFKLSINEVRKVTQDSLIKLFNENALLNKVLDYISYSSTSNILTITRNPYGFFSYNDSKTGTYKGVRLGDDGNITDEEFIRIISETLTNDRLDIIPNSIEIDSQHLCLPSNLAATKVKTKTGDVIIEGFSDYFIKDGRVNNMDLFKRRILGLVSYFPDIDALLPKFNKSTDFHITEIEMSDFQFAVYEKARVAERIVEKNNAKKKKTAVGEIYDNSTSTYRIFSRAFCNYVFPNEEVEKNGRQVLLRRPMPQDNEAISTDILETANEDLLDGVSVEEKLNDTEGKYDIEELETTPEAPLEVLKYEGQLKEMVKLLEKYKDQFLSPKALEIYSPKFLQVLGYIIHEDHIGLHLVYSQFRTLEGIGIFSLVLKANGFAQFKIVKEKDSEWKIDIPEEDFGKPTFVLYTGTESIEEKEIIRNIFNSNWSVLPTNLRIKLEKVSSNNLFGELIKIIMITASGAEGISLSNVRYVHLIEPYWHPVRIEQVIGRARRICSHKDLPPELQTVDVFLYLMKFSEKQLKSDAALELITKDKSKLDASLIYTSDQALYEISTIKENINKEILHNIKEASIDCNIHTKLGSKDLKCFTFGSPNPDRFSYTPDISSDEKDSATAVNKKLEKVKIKKITLPPGPHSGPHAWNPVTKFVYTIENYKAGKDIPIGTLEIIDGKSNFQLLVTKESVKPKKSVKPKD